MSPRNVRLWLAAACMLALGASPFLVRGDQQTRQVRAANRQLIANLSESDRERLQRSYEEYRQLSAADRALINEFHQKLTVDATEKQGALTRTMDAYLRWARTLPPYQREALMTEQDPQARLELVRNFAEQQSEREAQRLAFVEMGWLPPGVRGVFRDAPLLSPEELSTLMKEIELRQSRYFSEEERDRLNQLQGVERSVQTLKIVKEKSGGIFAMQGMIRQVLLDALPASPAAEYLKNLQAEADDSQFPEITRLGWMVVLAKSLFHEAIAQQRQAATPSDEALSNLLHSLPPEEQDRLLSLEAVEFRSELLRLFRQDKTPVKFREIAELVLPTQEERRRFEDTFRRFDGRGDSRRGRLPEFRFRGQDGRDGDPRNRPPSFRPPRFPPGDRGDDERPDRQGDQQR